MAVRKKVAVKITRKGEDQESCNGGSKRENRGGQHERMAVIMAVRKKHR